MAENQDENLTPSASESIKVIYELVTRIDERVKTLIKEHDELSNILEAQKERQSNANTRITILETQNTDDTLSRICAEVSRIDGQLTEIKGRIQLVEISSQGSEKKWNTAVTYFIQMLWLVLAGWLLYKLGLPAP